MYTTAMIRWRSALRTPLLLVAIAHAAPCLAQPAPDVPSVQLHLAGAPAADRARIELASREAVARYVEWLGPAPQQAIVVSDARRDADDTGSVRVALPWWPAPATMDLEAQVAFGIGRLWWAHLVAGEGDAPLRDGLAWYLQSRVVEELFDLRYYAEGHSRDAVRFFGGAVPWTFRLLRLGRWTAGLGRDTYVTARAPRPWPVSGRRHPPGMDAGVARVALAFGTLERHVGWPAPEGPMTLAAFSDRLGASVGQDLSWFFESAFDPLVVYDYAVTGLAASPTTCAGAPCVRSTVAVERRGAGVFSGRAGAPLGPFEAGDALVLRVRFADGQEVEARWDGRAPLRQFEFEGSTPVAAATLDPDRILLLDASHLDNRRASAGAHNVPVAKWVAQWLVWLQDAVLTYGTAF
jgi:hypothetical protein